MMPAKKFALLSAGLCFVAVVPAAWAATLTVDQGGEGDFVSIIDAVAAASDGDLILVTPGTYSESITVSASIQIESTNGPLATILDGQHGFRLLHVDGPHTVGISGFKLVRGYDADVGAAVTARNGASVTVLASVFMDNHAGYDGGAVHARHAGTTLTIDDCTFIGNTATHNGGAGNVILSATLEVFDSSFLGNSSPSLAGALASDTGANLAVDGCLFHENQGLVGGVMIRQSSGSVRHSTFHANYSTGHSSLTAVQTTNVAFEYNILSGDAWGHGMEFHYAGGYHACNLFWDNSEGPILGSGLVASEAVGDPLYCDLGGDNFTLGMSSPGAAAQNACGVLLGAFPAECGNPVPGEIVSWGSVKSRY